MTKYFETCGFMLTGEDMLALADMMSELLDIPPEAAEHMQMISANVTPIDDDPVMLAMLDKVSAVDDAHSTVSRAMHDAMSLAVRRAYVWGFKDAIAINNE